MKGKKKRKWQNMRGPQDEENEYSERTAWILGAIKRQASDGGRGGLNLNIQKEFMNNIPNINSYILYVRIEEGKYYTSNTGRITAFWARCVAYTCLGLM